MQVLKVEAMPSLENITEEDHPSNVKFWVHHSGGPSNDVVMQAMLSFETIETINHVDDPSNVKFWDF